MSYDFPAASYDAWKTRSPDDDWSMPSYLRPTDEELARYDRRRLAEWREHGGDDALYELMCEEEEQLARLEAHARDPDEEDYDGAFPPIRHGD